MTVFVSQTLGVPVSSQEKSIVAEDRTPCSPQGEVFVCCGLPVGNQTKVHSCRKCELPVHTIVLCKKVYLQDEQDGRYLCGNCVAGVLQEEDEEQDDQEEEEEDEEKEEQDDHEEEEEDEEKEGQDSDSTDPFGEDQHGGAALEESNEDDVVQVKHTPKHQRSVIESSDEESSNSGDEGFYDEYGLPKLAHINSTKLLTKSRKRADYRITLLNEVDQKYMHSFRDACDRTGLRLISGAAQLPVVLMEYPVAIRFAIQKAGVPEHSNERLCSILDHCSNGTLIHVSLGRIRRELDERAIHQVFKTIREGLFSLVTTP